MSHTPTHVGRRPSVRRYRVRWRSGSERESCSRAAVWIGRALLDPRGGGVDSSAARVPMHCVGRIESSHRRRAIVPPTPHPLNPVPMNPIPMMTAMTTHRRGGGARVARGGVIVTLTAQPSPDSDDDDDTTGGGGARVARGGVIVTPTAQPSTGSDDDDDTTGGGGARVARGGARRGQQGQDARAVVPQGACIIPSSSLVV